MNSRKESQHGSEYGLGVADVAANVARVQERIAVAARRSGRQREATTLVAVTKGVDVPRIEAAVACGITDLGETRVQEAVQKVSALLTPGVRWHMVGHLQRNKVRDAVAIFSVIHSVDNTRLAEDLNRRASALLDVLVQVNVAGEAQKHGVPPEDAPALIRAMARLPRLRLLGLMTIAPLADSPEDVRQIFRRLRMLRDEINALGIPAVELQHLSMGMTDDFEVAIEEGATIVRIGRAIFGERPSGP